MTEQDKELMTVLEQTFPSFQWSVEDDEIQALDRSGKESKTFETKCGSVKFSVSRTPQTDLKDVDEIRHSLTVNLEGTKEGVDHFFFVKTGANPMQSVEILDSSQILENMLDPRNISNSPGDRVRKLVELLKNGSSQT